MNVETPPAGAGTDSVATPRVGCGAAIVRGGRLLLVQRTRPPEAGCWSLPGGKVDAFEPVRAAVEREVLEELGVAVVAGALLGVVDLFADGQHWVSPVYLAEPFEGEPSNLEPEKHAAIGWFALYRLPEPLAASARAAAGWLAG